MDYINGPYTVTFYADITNVSFNVSINDDDILEGNENFILAINQSSLPNNVTVGDSGEATVTIVDNDGKIFLTARYRRAKAIISILIVSRHCPHQF